MVAWTAALLPSVQSAFEALLAHKLRSGLTLLSVLIGVAGVLVLDSVAQAQNAAVAAQLQQLGSNVVSISPTASNVRGLATGVGPTLRPNDAAVVRQLPHVVAASPVINGQQQISSGTPQSAHDDHRGPAGNRADPGLGHCAAAPSTRRRTRRVPPVSYFLARRW